MKKKPIILLPFYSIKGEEIQSKGCRDCEQKAEDLGIPVEKMCPECVSEGEEEYEELLFERMFIEDIKSWNECDGKRTTICFYSGKHIVYDLTVEEMDAKMSPFIENLEILEKV